MFQLKGMLWSAGMAFLAGIWVGGYGVYYLWGVSQMEAELRKVRKDQKRTAVVLKMNEKTDIEAKSIEQANEAIYENLLQKLKDRPVAPIQPGSNSNPADAECISAGDLLELDKFR